MDYRLKENRREAFIRWYAWSLKHNDCDPAVWATNYLHNRYEHNDEERIWLAWLYGNTYQLPTAWVLKNEFPDFELATVDRITQWNTAEKLSNYVIGVNKIPDPAFAEGTDMHRTVILLIHKALKKWTTV